LSASRSLATCVSVATNTNSPVASLDTSALVKLIAIEAAALRRKLRPWPDRASSLLGTAEVTRTVRRLGGQAPAVAVGVLAGLRPLAIDPIVPTAAQIGGTTLRSLDAIHLATAVSVAHQTGEFDRLPSLRGAVLPNDDGSQILALLAYPCGRQLGISVGLSGCALVSNGSVRRYAAGFRSPPAFGPQLVNQLKQLLSGQPTSPAGGAVALAHGHWSVLALTARHPLRSDARLGWAAAARAGRHRRRSPRQRAQRRRPSLGANRRRWLVHPPSHERVPGLRTRSRGVAGSGPHTSHL